MDKNFAKKKTHPVLIFWIIVGWVSYLVVPWYGVEDGFFRFEWLFDGYPFDPDYAPAAFLLVQGEKLWLAPLILPLLASFLVLRLRKSDPAYGIILILVGAIGFSWLIVQGFSIGIRGFNFNWLTALFGDLGDRQFGMGYGALILFIYALCNGASFNYDPSMGYTLSLLYLCIFGSIFAFGSYLTLIGRIGADKTAYMSVLFPVVALSISTVFESYHWSMLAIGGFALTQIGNYLVLKTARTSVRES